VTRAQKAALAALLIDRASVIVEFWGEHDPDLAAQVTVDEAAEQLATWLKVLPGNSWSDLLPQLD
jgi:hypothetical protein